MGLDVFGIEGADLAALELTHLSDGQRVALGKCSLGDARLLTEGLELLCVGFGPSLTHLKSVWAACANQVARASSPST